MASSPLDTSGWNPRLRALHDHWQSLRPAPDRLPSRRDFDPMAVPRLLPNIWLLDVRREPLRFRYRVVGTYMVMALGQDATGCWFHELYSGFGPGHSTYEDYRRLAMDGAVLWRRGRAMFAVHVESCTQLERVVLPLADDGVTVDRALGMTVHYADDGSEI